MQFIIWITAICMACEWQGELGELTSAEMPQDNPSYPIMPHEKVLLHCPNCGDPTLHLFSETRILTGGYIKKPEEQE